MPSVLERLRTALAPGIAVERELASGGMGIVLLGYDTELERPVAIKVLRPERATAIAVERFAREARHAAGLRHPNVVRVHHAGEADGLPYYTMDYMPGETLAARLARLGRYTPRQVVRLGQDLLAALEAAHAHHLIHRDVKPSNVFHDGDRALLCDFGVAHALDSSQTSLTQPGSPVGTLAYISPEQLREGPVTFRTDLYAVGLVLYEAAAGRRWEPLTEPSRGDWSRVPSHLRAPIRRALQIEPRDRWPDTASFAAALASAERRWHRARGLLAAAAAGGVGALLLLHPPWRGDSAKAPAVRDLVVFPFATIGLVDSSIGARVAGLTAWSFGRLEGLTLAPRQLAFRAWRGSTLPEDRRLKVLTGEVGSRYGAWAFVVPRGERLEVQLQVVDAAEQSVYEGTVTGDSMDLARLGDLVADTIVRSLFSDRRFGRAGALPNIAASALTEFMLGEEAFARDAWLAAERHYLRAFQLDSSFVLAGWRLGNTRRWMPFRPGPPYPPGLYQLYQSEPQSLPAVDRHLIEAQFLPSGTPRFERYERAIRIAGDDPYAALLYGDELFHRGPLAGRPLRDAVRVLERAVVTDSTLAPAWEHLAWALIRLGERERAARALAHLERLAGSPEESEIDLPMFLRIAYDLRFAAAGGSVGVAAALGRTRGALPLAARGALSFDLPAAQAEMGRALATTGESPALRASGRIAEGIALVALGRPNAALAAFDSAAALFPHPAEARLQAAEWRVVPPALGVPGVSGAERDRGRAVLLRLVDDSAAAARAAWALALDAHARGDTTATRAWSDRVRASAGAGQRLTPLLDGLEHAARERWDAALVASAPALAYDSAGLAPDPFLRAALHLMRGEWLARSGEVAAADRAWLWYENLDVRGWPDAEAQPAEVDWALGTYVRWRRARLALDAERVDEACVHARRVRSVWSDAEPGVAAAMRRHPGLEQRCRP